MLILSLYLLAAHFVCDYPLQGDFLSRAKQDGPLRLWHLMGHATIHGAAVSFITGSVALGLAEIAAHTAIDELKVRRITSFAQDQLLHVICKAVWVCFLACAGGEP